MAQRRPIGRTSQHKRITDREAQAWDPSSCLTHGERGNNVRLPEIARLAPLVRSKYGSLQKRYARRQPDA